MLKYMLDSRLDCCKEPTTYIVLYFTKPVNTSEVLTPIHCILSIAYPLNSSYLAQSIIPDLVLEQIDRVPQ